MIINPAAHNRNTYDALALEYKCRAASDFVNDVPIVARVWYHLSLRKNNVSPRVLDVGCGPGVNVEMFARLGCRSVGIDYSTEMVRVASEIAHSGIVIEGDFLASQWCEPFDLIFAKAFFHLFPLGECGLVLNKMRSVLRDDGLIYISTTTGERSSEGFLPKLDYPGARTRFRRTWSSLDLVDFLIANDFAIVDRWDSLEIDREKRWLNLLVAPGRCRRRFNLTR